MYNFYQNQKKKKFSSKKKSKLKLYPSYWRMKNVCKQMKWYLLFKLFTVVLIYTFHRPTSLRFLKDWHIVLQCLCWKRSILLNYSRKIFFYILVNIFSKSFFTYFYFLGILEDYVFNKKKKVKRKRCNNLHWMSFKIFFLRLGLI